MLSSTLNIFGTAKASGSFNVPITKIGASSFVAKNLSSVIPSNNIKEIKDAAFVQNNLTNIT